MQIGLNNLRNRVQVWVEDKSAARGPALVPVTPSSTLADLRREAETSLGVPGCLQRWVVRQAVASDDSALLTDLAGAQFEAPFYLCIVENVAGEAFLNELMQLEQSPLVSNSSSFECAVCMEVIEAGAGAVIRECAHSFCRPCLQECAKNGGGASCPASDCLGTLEPRELRAILTPADHEAWLARDLAVAESSDRQSFHCRTRDCVGWAFCEPEVQCFPCPVCQAINCLPCKAIHEGETCEQFQRRPIIEQEEVQSRNLLNEMIAKGQAFPCPQCGSIITKSGGCDYIACSSCKTGICWATRGRRWGPRGDGDNSGGCRCKVNGKKCHPKCGNCH